VTENAVELITQFNRSLEN